MDLNNDLIHSVGLVDKRTYLDKINEVMLVRDVDIIDSIIIHHGNSIIGGSKSISENFIKNNKLSIGYNIVIDEYGEGYFCLNLNEVGIHVSKDEVNNRSVSICLLGDFHNDGPTVKQITKTFKCIKYLQKLLPNINNIYGHGEIDKDNDCPVFNMNFFREAYSKYIEDANNIPDWYFFGISYMHSKKIINNKEYWANEICDDMPTWAYLLLLKNIHKSIENNKNGGKRL